MNIYDFIAAQDKNLSRIMDKLGQVPARETGIRGMLVNQARIQFGALSRVEGEHFYPALAIYEETKDVSEKHQGMVREISSALDLLEKADMASQAAAEQIDKLRAKVAAYLKSKEDELFKNVRGILPEDLAENLGRVAEQDINTHRRKLAGVGQRA